MMQLFRSNNLRYLFILGLYRAGNVVTIEPGIYFIPEMIDLWKADRKHDEYLNYQEIEKYKDFSGLRNEEDFVITEDGVRRLGKALPVTIDGVESIRQG